MECSSISCIRSLLWLLDVPVCSPWYDASAHLAEETRSASRFAPIGIISALGLSVLLGFFLLLALLFSIQDVGNTLATSYNQPVLRILVDMFGEDGAVVLFVFIMCCAWNCGLFTMTSNSRLVFAFSRDRAIPHYFSKVNDVYMCPVRAVWLSAFLAFCLSLPMLGSLVAFNAVTSIATIGQLISYGIPILIGMIYQKRFCQIKGPFKLGRASRPIALVAVLWISFISIILCLPTATPVTIKTLNYAAVAVGVVLICAVGIWFIVRKHFEGPIREKSTLIDGGNLLNS